MVALILGQNVTCDSATCDDGIDQVWEMTFQS